MEESIPTENLPNEEPEITQYTYEQVADALSEAGACIIPPPKKEDSWGSRQDMLQVLKTIELLIMKRKQYDEEAQSKRSKVIEPLAVRTKSNQALLDEAQSKKKSLLNEIEVHRQKLEALKQKKADQIIQHEKEFQDIKSKIDELSNKDKTKVKCSFSQSNVIPSSSSTLKETHKKKRKSEIPKPSKSLIDENETCEVEKSSTELIKTTRTRIPTRPRATYSQC